MSIRSGTDAIIYEVHVRAFSSSNADGMAISPGSRRSFRTATSASRACGCCRSIRLASRRWVRCADYTSINPIYGTLDDFKRLVDAAHALNIRILTELVINHTSDQHPWFQRARRAPKGSRARLLRVERHRYRCAGTYHLYGHGKIELDPRSVAGQYWHRFFSHQPDLNLDSPEVLGEIRDIMRFWLDLGSMR